MAIDIYKMDVCGTIQLMNSAMDKDYNPMTDFSRMQKMSIEDLEAERDQLIPKYNEAMSKERIVTFRGVECRVEYNEYQPGYTAISLTDVINREPYATATTFLDRKNFPFVSAIQNKNQVYIKDYSENEGITQALVEAKIVERIGERYDINGYEAMVDKCIIIDPKFQTK
jgi:hypothetical protein